MRGRPEVPLIRFRGLRGYIFIKFEQTTSLARFSTFASRVRIVAFCPST